MVSKWKRGDVVKLVENDMKNLANGLSDLFGQLLRVDDVNYEGYITLNPVHPSKIPASYHLGFPYTMTSRPVDGRLRLAEPTTNLIIGKR